MILKNESLTIEFKENMRGGKGAPKLTHVVDKEVLGKQGRMFAKMEMKPGESIGYHQHVGEQEIFYFLEGTGTVKDGDETICIGAGDVMVTKDGGFHSIENTGKENLIYMALILNTKE